MDIDNDESERSNYGKLGTSCGSVGRAVALNTRGPRFESSRQQIFIQNMCLLLTVEKTKNMKKRLEMTHLKQHF